MSKRFLQPGAAVRDRKSVKYSRRSCIQMSTKEDMLRAGKEVASNVEQVFLGIKSPSLLLLKAEEGGLKWFYSWQPGNIMAT